MSEVHAEEPAPVVEVPTSPEQELVREVQVLRWLKVSRTTLWRWVRSREFPSPVKLCGRTNRWRVEDLERWAQERSYVVAGNSPQSTRVEDMKNEQE